MSKSDDDYRWFCRLLKSLLLGIEFHDILLLLVITARSEYVFECTTFCNCIHYDYDVDEIISFVPSYNFMANLSNL